MRVTSASRPAADADTAPRGTGSTGGGKRLVVRRSTPVWPFVWRGMVPLLGLLFVAWYAVVPMARGLESDVRREVRSALDLRGYQWVNLAVSGQDVSMTGVVPTSGPSGGATAPTQALDIARQATCSTWIVRVPCAVSVVARFTDAAAGATVLASPNAPRSASPRSTTPAPGSRPNAQDGMTLPPSIPNPTVTAPPTVATATNAVPTPASGAAPAGVGSVVPPVVVGASTPNASPANGATPSAPSTVMAAVKACDAEMKRLLTASRIEFETGEAIITSATAPLLDQLAKAARTCPGVVRVEGHTDTVGGATDNLNLSVARAFAVRDALVERGLSPTQLLAEGFGEDRPVASNKTPDGRAKNRRIELRALAPPNS